MPDQPPIAEERWLPWRVGRSLGFTIYEQIGEKPSKDDKPLAVALGCLDDARAIAARIVADHEVPAHSGGVELTRAEIEQIRDPRSSNEWVGILIRARLAGLEETE